MDKLAFITGGAKRIGKEIVEHLAEKGWHVLIHYNGGAEAAQELQKSLLDKYPHQAINIAQFDLSDWKKADTFMKKCIQDFGSPDLLVHNAGIFEAGSFSTTSEELLEKMMAVHVYAPFFMSKVMVAQKGKGDIIAILDTKITQNRNTHAAYVLSKKCMKDFVEMAAVEWAPNFRVNGIAPGAVLPPPDGGVQQMKQVIEKSVLMKQVPLEIITKSIDYLLQNEIMTGQILYCDSGQHLI